MHGNNAVALVAYLAHVRRIGAGDGCIIGTDRFEHAQAVLVDVDAGAGGAQLLAALVHAHAPATLRERAGGGEPGKPGPGDFGVALRHTHRMLWQSARPTLCRELVSRFRSSPEFAAR